jgi:hypothetical protein
MRYPALADVLPSVAAALGTPVPGRPAVLDLPRADRAVVVLVDGLGERLLADRGGHAPFLRRLRNLPAAGVLRAGFPSTTATSIASFGTGLHPGAHGLVGLEVLDPDRDALFSELAWDDEVNPRRWQPHPTVFEAVRAAGVEVVRVGPAHVAGSGLSEAALRGGRVVSADTLDRRVDATVAAVRGNQRALVYLYWEEVDKVGHVCGCRSWQWGEAVGSLDFGLSRLLDRLPAGTLLVVTADHGMVDVPFEDRVDLAREPDLRAGVRHVGGEPRALHLYCRPGAAPDVLATWRERFAGTLDVRSRGEVLEAGWFGPVEDRVVPRIGDVVTTATGSIAVVDSRTARPAVLALVGLHGARTDAEQLVPLLVAVAG